MSPVLCICSPLQISESFRSFGMSDESRNVLVVTFEDSAEPVKVCVCVRACVRAYMSAYMRAHMCVCMCGEPLLLPCLCVHACIRACVCVHACVCVVWCGCRWVWLRTCMLVYVGRVESLCSYLVYSHVWEAVKGLVDHSTLWYLHCPNAVSCCKRSDQGRNTTTGSASSLPRCGWHCKSVYAYACGACF